MADIETDAYDPNVAVPEGARTLKTRDAFSLWFSLGIGLLVLQAGVGLVPGLSFAGALAAILIGSLLGAVLLALAGVVGADTGLATIAALKPTLGRHGAALPAVLNVIQLFGWGIFEIVAMRDAADALTKSAFHLSAPVVWTIVFGVAATALAVMGPLSFVRQILRRFGLWLVLLGAAWLTWALLSRHDLAGLFAIKGTGALSLGAGIDMVCAMPLSWLPLIADYTRFGKARDMFRGSAAGYLLANIWFYALGAAFAVVASGGQDVLLSALAATGGGFALLMILIDETDNVFADIFSAATSAATVFRLKVRDLTIAFGALCTGLALIVPMGQFVTFLYMIGSVFAPLYGVLLADHFGVRRRRAAEMVLGFNLPALACWGLGVVAYYAIMQYLPALGATLPALALSGGLYLGFKRVVQ
jgi:NCS1 family nucleobase:cation symporter-1